MNFMKHEILHNPYIISTFALGNKCKIYEM